MQTTIQLDEALLAKAAEVARKKGCGLSDFIEETLREKIATKSAASHPFVHLTTVGGTGVRPGVDLDNSAALLGVMEQRG
jgi:hypothetical protein